MTVYGPTPKRCVVLDGLFLAVDIGKIGQGRFDEQLAFHFYDLDFCLAAHRAGLILGTTNVYVTHRSGGNLSSPAFKAAQTAFRAKWKAGEYRIDAPQPLLQGHPPLLREANRKQGRNELCYCGSGRKYKHCHGQLG